MSDRKTGLGSIRALARAAAEAEGISPGVRSAARSVEQAPSGAAERRLRN
jgi:hypothetical protein